MPRPGRKNRLATQPIHILDLNTTSWVDYWWLFAQRRKMKIQGDGHCDAPNAHAIKNAGRFREYLMRIHQGGSGLSLSDFATPPILQGPSAKNVSATSTFPAEAAAWCEKGRRLFRIDRSLQTLLRLTSLNNVQWEHVRWPLDAFAIELSQPIIDPTGRVWDFILVSTYNNEDVLMPGDDGPVLQMSFFSRARSKYEPIRAEDKQRLETLIQQRKLRDANHLALRLDERFHRDVVIPRSIFRYHKAKLTGLVTDTAERWRDELMRTVTTNIPEGAYEVWDAMIRIVVGLALYLKTPSGCKQIVKVNEPRRDGLPDVTVITDGTQIFTVSSTSPLTQEEIDIEDFVRRPEQEGGQAKWEMRTHWRQGYWSRKAGEGHIVDAEKTIWHRPTLVRADRLPADLGLPAGTAKEDTAK